MNSLLFCIYQLPQEIQDIISMYNVEHRKNMKLVCRDLEKEKCDACGGCVSKMYSINLNVFFHDYVYCSETCAHYHESELRIVYRRYGHMQYLYTHTHEYLSE